MERVILVKYGEIALRKSNRLMFENRLVGAIHRHLPREEGYTVSKEQGRLVVEKAGGIDTVSALQKLKDVLGVTGLSECVKTQDQSCENLQKIALSLLEERFGRAPFTFKVETKRADKRYPMTGYEVSSAIGGYVLEHMENAAVDVHNPQATVHVELRCHAYLFTDGISGLGGLPAGTSGKGMLMLSGGIDSPVAGFLMAKRGVALQAVYFHSPPFTSDHAKQKALDLAARLSDFAESIRLYVVNFTDIQTYLYDNVAEARLTILLKRAMLRAADTLAVRNGCLCVITGDAVGQVASQTLNAIHAADSAASLPVLRPLAGFDKVDITRIAAQIETFPISARPFEDCCTVFVARHPELKPKAYIIEGIERRLTNLSGMIDKSLETAEIYDF